MELDKFFYPHLKPKSLAHHLSQKTKKRSGSKQIQAFLTELESGTRYMQIEEQMFAWLIENPSSVHTALLIQVTLGYCPSFHLAKQLQKLLESDFQCYFELQESIRLRLLELFWEKGFFKDHFETTKHADKTPEELFYRFYLKYSPQISKKELDDFLKKETAYTIGLAFFHRLVDMSLFTKNIAQSLHNHGYQKPSLHWLSLISVEDQAYPAAIECYQFYCQQSQTSLTHPYISRLKGLKDWVKRLDVLKKVLEEGQQLTPTLSPDHVVLNTAWHLLPDIFPKLLPAYKQLTQLLYQNIGSKKHFPSLDAFFIQNMFKPFDQVIDIGVWKEVRQEQADTPIKKLWNSIALFRHFLFSTELEQNSLWQAKNQLEEIEPLQSIPDWQEVVQWGSKILSQMSSFDVLSRKKQLLLHAAVNYERLSYSSIEEFLSLLEGETSEHTQKSLIAVLHKKGWIDLAFRLETNYVHNRFFTNKKLLEIAHLAAADKNHDMAWIACTVLHFRKVLEPSKVKMWQVSGENRTIFNWTPFSHQFSSLLFLGFEPMEQKFFKLLFKLSPKIHSFAQEFLDNPDLAINQIDPQDALAYKNVLNIPFFASMKRLSFDDQLLSCHKGINIPVFYDHLPQGTFSYLLSLLTSVSGMNLLHMNIEEVKSFLFFQDNQNKKARNTYYHWHQNLSLPIKKQIHAAQKISGLISQERFYLLCQRLYSRLAILLHPNHYRALTELNQARVNVEVIKDLECFILSYNYSRFRRMNQLDHQVIFPKI